MSAATTAQRLDMLTAAGRAQARRAALLGSGDGLLAIGQAFVIAFVIGGLAGTPMRLPGWEPIAVFVILAVGRSLFSAGASRLAFESGRTVKTAIRERLIARLGSWSPVDGARPASGAAAALGADHVEAIEPYLTRFMSARMRVTILPVAILLVTAWYSWAAALILVVAGPLIPIFMMLIGIYAKSASDRQLAALVGINAYLADRLAGMQDIKVLGAEDRVADQIEGHALDLKKATMSVLRVAFLSSTALELFAALGVALMAVYIGFHLLGYFTFGTWAGSLTLGEGLLLLMLAPDFFTPMRDFAATYHDRASAFAAADALDPVLNGPRVALPERQLAVAGGAAVSLTNVRFSYPEARQPVIDDFSLVIARGRHVALSGASGAGKSTLLALIGGLVAPQSGMVVLGTERIAWLGQSPHFLRTSLRRNLTLGREGIDEAGLREAVAAAGAEDVLMRLPAGFDTVLGESAQGLSGGEAQRMALARAYLADADLILADEPTAHLDAATSAAVSKGLMELARGRTLVIATHDPVLMAKMDEVIAVGEPLAGPAEVAQ